MEVGGVGNIAERLERLVDTAVKLSRPENPPCLGISTDADAFALLKAMPMAEADRLAAIVCFGRCPVMSTVANPVVSKHNPK